MEVPLPRQLPKQETSLAEACTADVSPAELEIFASASEKLHLSDRHAQPMEVDPERATGGSAMPAARQPGDSGATAVLTPASRWSPSC